MHWANRYTDRHAVAADTDEYAVAADCDGHADEYADVDANQHSDEYADADQHADGHACAVYRHGR